MNLYGNLEKKGIVPIMPLRVEEKSHIAKNVAYKLTTNILQLADSYNEIYMRIFNCDMYFAKVDSKFKGVFYFYKNNTIYIDESRKDLQIDEYIIHECIHYLQNFSNITKRNNRAGLCEFTEFKINRSRNK